MSTFGSFFNRRRNLSESFVSALAMRCVEECSSGKVEFHPWAGEAALLFIDLSGYSAITAAFQDKNAWLLSTVVNSYLEKIIRIVQRFHGYRYPFPLLPTATPELHCWPNRHVKPVGRGVYYVGGRRLRT